jgi:hypothetical protein
MQERPPGDVAATAKKVFGICQRGLWHLPKTFLANAAKTQEDISGTSRSPFTNRQKGVSSVAKCGK